MIRDIQVMQQWVLWRQAKWIPTKAVTSIIRVTFVVGPWKKGRLLLRKVMNVVCSTFLLRHLFQVNASSLCPQRGSPLSSSLDCIISPEIFRPVGKTAYFSFWSQTEKCNSQHAYSRINCCMEKLFPEIKANKQKISKMERWIPDIVSSDHPEATSTFQLRISKMQLISFCSS